MTNNDIDPRFDLSGKVFHEWTVLRRSDYKNPAFRDWFWDCRCSCGHEQPVRACYLRSGGSKRCVDCGHERQRIRGRTIPLGYWAALQRNAAKRNIEFGLSETDVEQLVEKQAGKCALSGLPICFAETASDHLRGRTTASVDRVDSTKGYLPGNIQLVHKTINFMKATMTQADFLFFCLAVADQARSGVSEEELST